MTPSLPSLEGQRQPKGVRTNGVGKSTVRHLNLTRSLAYFDEKKVQTKVRKELRLARKEEASRVAK